MGDPISSSLNVERTNQRDSADMLYSNSLGSLLGSFVAASALVFGFPSAEIQTFKHVWFLAMLLLLGARSVDFFYWHLKLRGNAYPGEEAIRRFLFGSVSTALMWSVYAVFCFDFMDPLEYATTLIIVAGFASGASTVLAGHKNIATAYVVMILLPVSVVGVLSQFEYRQILGAIGLLFSLVLSLSARKAASFTSSALEIKNHNAELIERMKVERSEVSNVHKQLSEANEKLNQANNSLEAEVKRRTEKISQLSNRDPLTGLYNRSAFTHQLKDLIKRSEDRGTCLAILFIDLNGFKKINDTLGHKVGDGVLTEIASRIEAFANDYHAGRWGGDEFLIALPYCEKDIAMSVAKAVQTRIAQPLHIFANQMSLSASVGIAMFPEHSTDELELIQLADFAMFEQKKAGLNEPKFFTQDLYQNIKYTQTLRDGLQQAISKRELHLCYQPIMCCKTNAPWAFEALLRWTFDGKPVRPDEFIPLAEQSGLIRDIGSWVLNRACIDARQWAEASDASVSVNVSVIQLLDDTFIETLDKALNTSGLPPEKLHLEITESMFTDNKDKVLAQLDAITSRGVQVSIDDFGTGYSSLNQLQNLDVDTIKIDKTFVQNFDQGGEAIIRATLFIAKEFGCNSVAEGVETEEQANALNALGVDYLQGYLFAKPLPKDELFAALPAILKVKHSANS